MAEVKDTTTALERAVADIAGRFAATPFNQIDEAIVEWTEVLALDPENRSAKMYLRMVEAQRSARISKTPPPAPSTEEPLT